MKPVKYFTDRSKGGTSFVDILLFSVLWLLCVCARLFICACGHLLGRADLLAALVCEV